MLDFSTFQFDTIDVKQAIVDTLKTGLQKLGYTGKNTVKVIKADPQSPSEIPCIGVNRADDSESSQSLTDGEGTLYDPVAQTNQTFYGTFFSEAQEIRIWHTNADEREKLYQAVKALLYALRFDLGQQGVINFNLRSGRDEQDTTMVQAPMPLYFATFIMTYLNPLDVAFTEPVSVISAVNTSGTLKG